MKVKRNLKNKLIRYRVEESWNLFGSPFFLKENVYALNPEQAVKRCLKKRKRFSEIDNWRPEGSREWSKWRIVTVNKPFERFAVYFK
jgi:hypothetical protein